MRRINRVHSRKTQEIFKSLKYYITYKKSFYLKIHFLMLLLHFCCFTFKNAPSCTFLQFKSCEVIVVKKKGLLIISVLRHTEPYLYILRSLCNPCINNCHIQNSDTFRIRGIFKSLWNMEDDQVYSNS